MATPDRYNDDTPAPYDIIGDVHGCRNELISLVYRLGYQPDGSHPADRRLIFLGDLVNRGYANVQTAEWVTQGVLAHRLLFIPGNNDWDLVKWLRGENNKLSPGLLATIRELAGGQINSPFSLAFQEIVQSAPPYLILDRGRLIVAHAGIEADRIGKTDPETIHFTLHGEKIGVEEATGRIIRRDWAADYSGSAFIVYGHTPVERAEIRNSTINIDTGCVLGGYLTAFRWPEKEIVQVQSGYDWRQIRPQAEESQE